MLDEVIGPEPQVYGEEKRHKEVLSMLSNIADLLDEGLDDPTPRLEIPPNEPFPLEKLVSAYPRSPSAEELAMALAQVLPDHREVLEETARNLARLNKKVSALSIMPGGGSSDGATETTLREIEGVMLRRGEAIEVLNDFATQTTLAAILSNLTAAHTLEYAPASIAGGSYAPVLTFTPVTDVVVEGISGDLTALLDTRYRIKLTVGASDKFEEQLDTNANSFTPLKVDVPSGTATSVQLRHSEVTPQNCAATIQWRPA